MTAAKLLALLSALCCSGFVAAFAYVHAARRDVSPLRHSLSTYLTDRTRTPLTIGYALLIAALLLRGGAVAANTSQDAVMVVAASACIAAAAMLGVVTLTARRSATGDELRSQRQILAHRYGAWAAFGLAILSMACATGHRWQHGDPSAAAFAALTACAIALFAVAARGPGARYGLWQKLLVLNVVAWLCMEAAATLANT